MKGYRGGFMAAKLASIIAGLMLAIIGLSAADIPNLAGNWTGSFEGYENGMGYVNANETGTFTMMISEQTGRLYAGNFSLNVSSNPKDLRMKTEGFSGIIALDNKTLYMAEYDSGYDIGTVISNDTIELDYLEDGQNAGAFIEIFHRMKESDGASDQGGASSGASGPGGASSGALS
jgi:hypothetical protein